MIGKGDVAHDKKTIKDKNKKQNNTLSSDFGGEKVF